MNRLRWVISKGERGCYPNEGPGYQAQVGAILGKVEQMLNINLIGDSTKETS